MDKKKNEAKKRGIVRTVQNLSLVCMVCVVIGLTAAVIALLALNNAFSGRTTLDMDRFSQSANETEGTIGDHLLPSFIGIRAKGEQRGISAGYNTVYDLYALTAPVLRDVLGQSFRKVSADQFESAVNSDTFVYLKYHAPLPWQAIYICAGGTEESYDTALSIYEMVILPDRGFRVLVRSEDREVYLFEGTYKSYFTVETLSDLLQSYRRNMADFVFLDKNDGVSTQEPVFTERIRTKNMLITEKTAALIQNRESHIAAILRLMNFNPDKLYAHEESDIGFVYVENHGVLRLLDDSVEYTAASADGGISIDLFISRYGRSDVTFGDYMETASAIVARVRALSGHYAGGDADVLLDSAVTEKDGSTVLRFRYTFDNLRLSECEPALVLRFNGGKLTECRLFTVSARNLGVQENSFLEQWYCELAEANCPKGWEIADVCPVYRTDFYSDSISAEWSVVYSSREVGGRNGIVRAGSDR